MPAWLASLLNSGGTQAAGTAAGQVASQAATTAASQGGNIFSQLAASHGGQALGGIAPGAADVALSGTSGGIGSILSSLMSGKGFGLAMDGLKAGTGIFNAINSNKDSRAARASLKKSDARADDAYNRDVNADNRRRKLVF